MHSPTSASLPELLLSKAAQKPLPKRVLCAVKHVPFNVKKTEEGDTTRTHNPARSLWLTLHCLLVLLVQATPSTIQVSGLWSLRSGFLWKRVGRAHKLFLLASSSTAHSPNPPHAPFATPRQRA